jgi:pyruvate/2-oxoglutarate dehydrogenase complex dihydrolipoamide acyltransferase (E2) component
MVVDEKATPATMLLVKMSVDHCVFDGAEDAYFLGDQA